MSLRLSSDIVMDVIRAADPQRAEAALRKLDGGAFSDYRDTAGAAPSASVAAGVRIETPLSAEQRFSAMAVQSFVSLMLEAAPKQAFGKGVAGSLWSSLLAEQLARDMVRQGAFPVLVQTPPDKAA